jgi:TonB family protein
MATDTARVPLELASGRNEVTAPFHETAQRRRRQENEDPASVDAPAGVAATRIDVPLAAASSGVPTPVADPEASLERGARTPWIAFAIAIVSVGFAVWWVMAQRIPDIDPRNVIARNLNDARTAMADGRYTDPPEHSALHYFSTVLALDPANSDAIAGIDAIADRHLTNARLLLSQKRIAEAGVALEKARRVRPDHEALAVLDRQWRAELRDLLTAATAAAKPTTQAIEKPAATNAREKSASRPSALAASEVRTTPAKAPLPSTQKVADITAVASALAASEPSTSLPEMAQPAPDTAANAAEATAAVSAPPTPVATAPAPPAVEPKLIKVVHPKYPQEALMRGIEGWVDVSLQVTASGDVIEPRVEDSDRGRLFNKVALAAVEQWKYEPRSDGATSERFRVRLKFQRSN